MVAYPTNQMQKTVFGLRLLTSGIVVLVFGLIATITHAQDAVYKYRDGGRTSKVSGKISDVTPNGVTIGGAEIAAFEIKKVIYGKEPTEVERARSQMESGRFADAIEELGKIPNRLPKPIQEEVDFIKAFSNSQISLRGGNVTPKVAASEVKSFIEAHPTSFHLFPMIDQFAKLAFAAGIPNVAETEFKKLKSATWPEFKLKGLFNAGQMQIELGKLAEAKASFEAIQAIESNDDLTQTYKLLSDCELARLVGLQGDAVAAQKALEKIIKDENPDNKKLFAHLYNALGSVHEKADRKKEAARAYLHTELLFASESEAHAEAVYRLAKIWPLLEETDRANRARETIKTRYRNSYWATKL